MFSSATIFDEHQNDSAPVVCYNPEERGLEKTDGIWHKKESLAPTRRPPPPIRPPHQEAQDGGQDGTQTDAGPAGRP